MGARDACPAHLIILDFITKIRMYMCLHPYMRKQVDNWLLREEGRKIYSYVVHQEHNHPTA
jgi:hypothetical protein